MYLYFCKNDAKVFESESVLWASSRSAVCCSQNWTCEFHPSFAGTTDYGLQPLTQPGILRGFGGLSGIFHQLSNIWFSWKGNVCWRVLLVIIFPDAPSHKAKNGNKICSPRRNTRSAGAGTGGEGSDTGHYLTIKTKYFLS